MGGRIAPTNALFDTPHSDMLRELLRAFDSA